MANRPNTNDIASAAPRRSSGRPPKYGEPSRPVTVTLPDSTLKGLERIDADRGKAIVKLTRAAVRSGDRPLVEVIEVAEGTGLVIVGPSQTLRRVPFLHLVEVAPARYLLAMDRGSDFRALEIELADLLDDLSGPEDTERPLLQELLAHIRRIRKSGGMRMAEILLAKLD